MAIIIKYKKRRLPSHIVRSGGPMQIHTNPVKSYSLPGGHEVSAVNGMAFARHITESVVWDSLDNIRGIFGETSLTYFGRGGP